MADKITVIVKAANQSVPDFEITCPVEWTVLNLKERISAEHPSQPTVKEQRLIYSGQLMLDHMILQKVLRHIPDNNTFTVHLVCSLPKHLGSPVSLEQSSTLLHSNRSSSSAMASSVASSDSSSESTEGLHHRTNGAASEPATPNATPSVSSSSVYPSMWQDMPMADANQQLAAMHQIYAQYMASYMQYMQMGGLSTLLPCQILQYQPVGVSASPTAPVTADDVPPAEDQLPANAAVNQDQPVQPQGAVVDDEEEGMARDWLYYLYVGARLAVILSIVYYYSTLSRFMMVLLGICLVYFYHVGWWRVMQLEPGAERQRDGQANNAILVEEQVRAVERLNEEDNNNRAVAGNTQDLEGQVEVSRHDGTVAEVPIPPRPSVFALTWTFLTTFFTSLIPEQPQLV